MVRSVGRCVDGAVAVDALDLDGGPHLAVELGVAVDVLDEVAIDAVHALFQVDVQQVDRHAVAAGWLPPRQRSSWRRAAAWRPSAARCVTSCTIVGRAWSSRLPLRSFLKTARKTQPWPWKSANWVCSGLRVQLGDAVPGTRGRTRGRGPTPRRGWSSATWTNSSAVGCFCFCGIHQLAVGLLVPPHVAEVAVHDVGAGVDVADDALAGGDGRGEPVLDRDGRVRSWGWSGRGSELRPRLPSCGVGAGVDRRAVVGVDDVAGGAAAGAIVAGVVVGAQEVERRVEQARLAAGRRRPGRCGSAVPRPRMLSAGPRPAGSSSIGSGMPISGGSRPPRSKMRRMLPGWRDLEARQRIEVGHDALVARSPSRSAAARFAAAAGRRSCCSSRRSGPA